MCKTRFLVALAAAGAMSVTVAAQARIVCLGDSITESITPSRPSYRFALWNMLGGTCVDFVGSNFGVANGQRPVGADRYDQDYTAVSGITARSVAQFLTPWLQASPPPPPPGFTADYALVHLGTNDILLRPATVPVATNTAQIVADLNTIIAALRVFEPGVTPVVAQIIPTAAAATNVEIAQLNAALATPGALPAGTLLANAFQGYDGARDNFDGVHPAASGEAKIAAAFHAVLAPRLLTPVGFACFEQFGYRCSTAHPRLQQVGGRPVTGTTFRMDVVGVPVGDLVFGVLSGVDLPTPIALGTGAPDCMQLVNNTSSTLVGSGPTATWLLPIPNTPSLSGSNVFVQGVVFGGGLNAAGIAPSNAGIVHIGDV